MGFTAGLHFKVLLILVVVLLIAGVPAAWWVAANPGHELTGTLLP